MAKAYLRIQDMTWPSPEHAGDLEYKLRYSSEYITRGDQLVAASILAAYRELVSMTAERRRRIVRLIREAESHDISRGDNER